MSTVAVEQMPMKPAMIQAFMRDVTGRVDVSDLHVARIAPGQMVVIVPDGPDLHVRVNQEAS